MATDIPYCDLTLNATAGCKHSGMPGCDHCWAKDLWNKRHKAFLAGKWVSRQYAKPFESYQFFPWRLQAVLKRKKPTTWFWCSMSDMFYEDVPFEDIDQMYRTMRDSPRHTHLILTKRPERMLKYYDHAKPDPFWERLWPGISCSTQPDLEKLAPTALQIPGRHWLSFEPLIESINARTQLMLGNVPGFCLNCGGVHGFTRCPNYGGISPTCDETGCRQFLRRDFSFEWVVVGCEKLGRNTPGRFCEDEVKWWDAARDIKEQCQAAGVKVYVKQGPVNGKVTADPKDFPPDMRVREPIR